MVSEASLVVFVREALEAAGCHLPSGFVVDVHMLRATAACHALAIGLPITVVMERGAWTCMASLDPYIRTVVTSVASHRIWGFMRTMTADTHEAPEQVASRAAQRESDGDVAAGGRLDEDETRA